MFALRNGQVTNIDLVETQGKNRQVPADNIGLKTALSQGICLGDRYDAQQ